jgi:cytochrome c-type biogenesis protein CcmH/NrfG
MSNSLISPGTMQRSVAFLAIVCLAAIFVFSLLSRVQNPSITVESRSAPSGQEQAMLAEVSNLMAEVERNPENIEAMTELAHIFMVMQAWERSLAFWKRVLALEPENKLALNQAGFTLFQQERYSEAADYFEKLLELDEENLRSMFNLGIIYKYYLDDQGRAVGYFQKILDIGPEDPQLIERVRRELDNPLAEQNKGP